MISSNELGDLGFGWKSFKRVGSFAARVGKGAYNVAAVPTRAMLRVANATQGVLCKDGGASSGSTAQAFCRAAKYKDAATMRRLLPQATALAARAARAKQVYTQAQAVYRGQPAKPAGMSAADMNLLASMDDAAPDDLAFALAGVDPGEIGAVLTRTDAVVILPGALAVAAGFWMLFRG
jgi:hypothetical protein